MNDYTYIFICNDDISSYLGIHVDYAIPSTKLTRVYKQPNKLASFQDKILPIQVLWLK